MKNKNSEELIKKIAILGIMVNNDIKNYLLNDINPFNETVFSPIFGSTDASELLDLYMQ